MSGATTTVRSLGLSFATLFSLGAEAAEPAVPYELRVEGALPVQYLETVSNGSRSHSESYAPFLAVAATALVAPDISTSVFANGGHDPPGRFRDGDSTVASFGANIVKHWGALATGVSVEHTYFYADSFGRLDNIANDVNLFARYNVRPNPDLKINPEATMTARFDEALAIQRYSYSFRIEIEQRLIDQWWLIARPRVRYSDYVGAEAGRRDFTASLVSGLKYQFNPNVSFVAVAGVEDRSSNVTSRNRDRFVVGASLDFNFSPRLPW